MYRDKGAEQHYKTGLETCVPMEMNAIPDALTQFKVFFQTVPNRALATYDWCVKKNLNQNLKKIQVIQPIHILHFKYHILLHQA